MDVTKAELAKITAARWHDEVNHKYHNTLPYSFHTDLVQKIAYKYLSLIPEDKRVTVLAAAALHDVIEDCRKSYNNVESSFGRGVAEIVYAVSNEKGRTRKERANLHYYKGINDTPYAVFVKLCDRIANVLGGYILGGKMLEVYRKENEDFINNLNTEKYKDMVVDLKILLTAGIFNFTPIDEVHDVTD